MSEYRLYGISVNGVHIECSSIEQAIAQVSGNLHAEYDCVVAIVTAIDIPMSGHLIVRKLDCVDTKLWPGVGEVACTGTWELILDGEFDRGEFVVYRDADNHCVAFTKPEVSVSSIHLWRDGDAAYDIPLPAGMHAESAEWLASRILTAVKWACDDAGTTMPEIKHCLGNMDVADLDEHWTIDNKPVRP
jgi:hypothetical protein